MPIFKPLLSKYKEFLPVGKNTPLITLGEGATPLVQSLNIGPSLGCKNLYFKLEGCNPTGSFKDRGMVLAVAKALEKDKNLRLFAEFDNFRKRTIKERIELYSSANKDIMTSLLPILDNFER